MSSIPDYIVRDQITKEQLDRLRKMSLMIGTPKYAGQSFATYDNSMLALKELFTKLGIRLGYQVLVNESLINRARDMIANVFMESNFTHLLFIDADIGFQPNDVLSMLLADKGVIGGAYPKKSINWEAALKAVKAGVSPSKCEHCNGNFVYRPLKDAVIKPFEPKESLYLGTGFMMIQREVFEKIKPLVAQYEPNSMPTDKGKNYWEFFPTGVVGRELLSEDYYFCHLAAKAEEKLWLAPWIYLTHTGTYTFSGCFFCSQGVYIHNLGQEAKKKDDPVSVP